MSHRLNDSLHFFYMLLLYLFIYLLTSRPCTHTLALLPASTNTTQYKGTLAFGELLLIHDALESSCPFQTLF